MDKKATIFPEGMMFKRPRTGAPEFVKGHISVNIESFMEFMKKFPEAKWLNIDLLLSKEKNLYLKLNTYNMKGVITAEEKVEEDGIGW